MKKILITGITGFVGTNLARYLAKHTDLELYGLIREGSNTAALKDVDIKRFFKLEELDQCEVDGVVHAIGKAHDLEKKSAEHEYFKINQYLTQNIYDWYLASGASKFIYISSIKAVRDRSAQVVDETLTPQPADAYGKSKLKAEQYILSAGNSNDYILRPCIIHGPGNKGNLSLLHSFLSKGIPYPLGAFQNQRSFLSIENLCFVIHQLLTREITGGVYHVADDQPLSTVELVEIMGGVLNKKPKIWSVPARMISFMARAGDQFSLPLNSERLQKLTESYVVSNTRIKEAIDRPFPLSVEEGLRKTFASLQKREVSRSDVANAGH